ncbi:unnamed protein product [Clavelina lepadiformis]|uniref:Uncharacterized protein n=1 Tax=Clavelina lepadiformis TaxID=159417 RepID=A0ABP0GHA7_CLALP
MRRLSGARNFSVKHANDNIHRRNDDINFKHYITHQHDVANNRSKCNRSYRNNHSSRDHNCYIDFNYSRWFANFFLCL